MQDPVKINAPHFLEMLYPWNGTFEPPSSLPLAINHYHYTASTETLVVLSLLEWNLVRIICAIVFSTNDDNKMIIFNYFSLHYFDPFFFSLILIVFFLVVVFFGTLITHAFQMTSQNSNVLFLHSFVVYFLA